MAICVKCNNYTTNLCVPGRGTLCGDCNQARIDRADQRAAAKVAAQIIKRNAELRARGEI